MRDRKIAIVAGGENVQIDMKALRNAAGVVLIILGLVGLVLPIIPGIPLIVGGAALLGAEHPLVRQGRAWLKKRGLPA